MLSSRSPLYFKLSVGKVFWSIFSLRPSKMFSTFLKTPDEGVFCVSFLRFLPRLGSCKEGKRWPRFSCRGPWPHPSLYSFFGPRPFFPCNLTPSYNNTVYLSTFSQYFIQLFIILNNNFPYKLFFKFRRMNFILKTFPRYSSQSFIYSKKFWHYIQDRKYNFLWFYI